MAEYIEREAVEILISRACEECREGCLEFDGIYADCHQCLFEGVKNGLPKLPSADVAPVRHGRWTDKRTVEHDGEWYCSACGNEVTICMCGKDKTWEYPYCPNCGADMREVGNEPDP